MCVTTNVNTVCCTTNEERVGFWYYPNGTIVPGHGNTAGDTVFTRTAEKEMVFLNRRANAVGPLGVYSCIVPDGMTAENVSASVTITGNLRIIPQKTIAIH